MQIDPNKIINPINLASKYVLAQLIENENINNPVSINISLTESDSNALIDKLASAIKFKEINGDQDNSFNEGSEDKNIEPDENGNYVGKGKTTIYDRDINLTNPEKSTERWVETPTGKVSDGDTEQVPNPQGTENFNESSLNIVSNAESLLETHSINQAEQNPIRVIRNILNYKF